MMSNRENEWFAKRMTITTREGMLRQYQLEEEMRGYKLETLEFKSPDYILKNYIAGIKRRGVEKRYLHDKMQALESNQYRTTDVADNPRKLRKMTNRNAIAASIENSLYLLKQSAHALTEAAYSPVPSVRLAFACACATLIAAVSYAALLQYQQQQTSSEQPVATAHHAQTKHSTL